MSHPRIWRPSSRDNYSDFMDDARGLQPPPVPPKPAPHAHSHVSWQPPSRTYAEEANIAARMYTGQVPAETPTKPETSETFRAADAWRHVQGGAEETYEPTMGEGLRALVTRTWLNVLLVFVPVAWVAHFLGWNSRLVFAFCFVAIIPLQILLDFTGSQLALYTAKGFGALLQTTINNAAQATLAVILLTRCELRLLQSTVVGVVLLQVLLIPGIASLTGQAREHRSPLDHALLSIAVLALLVPAAFFAAINSNGLTAAGVAAFEVDFLQMSRGTAVILLVVYLGSFILPKPVEETFVPATQHEAHLMPEEEPYIPRWLCFVLLVVFLALLVFTILWLVDSFDFIAEEHFTAEWFGLILLPFLSFGADILVAASYAVQRLVFPRSEPLAPRANWLAVHLSIQYTLFWLPILILLSWILARPLTLLFDLYEVVLLVGVLYLINGVAVDPSTTPAEGLVLLSAYVVIGLCTWFYTGQTAIQNLLVC